MFIITKDLEFVSLSFDECITMFATRRAEGFHFPPPSAKVLCVIVCFGERQPPAIVFAFLVVNPIN